MPFAVMLLFALGISSAHAQNLGSEAANRWLAKQKMLPPNPYFQSINIAQIEETRSLNIILGQVRILRDTGWDAPLWANFNYDYNNLRPLFQYNSQVYVDSVITDPFHLNQGDTLNYHLDFGFLPPPSLDTNAVFVNTIRFEDSLEYTIDLITVPDNNRIVLLDSMRFGKSDSLYEWIVDILTYSAGFQHGSPFNPVFIADSTFSNTECRLRLLVNFMGPYEHRWIERYDGYELFLDMIRDSVFLAEVEYVRSLIVASLGDTLEKPEPPRLTREKGVQNKIPFALYPLTINDMAYIQLGPTHYKSLTLKLYDNKGSVVDKMTITMPGDGIFTRAIECGHYPSGTYHFVIIAPDNSYSITKATILH